MAQSSTSPDGIEFVRTSSLEVSEDYDPIMAGLFLLPMLKKQMAARQKQRHFFVTVKEEVKWATAYFGKDSWQVAYVTWINSHRVQMVLAALLVIDVLVVVAELFLDAHFPYCYIIERDAISCCNISSSPDDHHRRQLAESSSSYDGGHHDAHHQLCAAGLTQVSTPATCDPHAHETVHVLHEVLFYLSVVILVAFAMELLVLFIVFRLNFFRTPLYVLDFIVISTALALEISLKGTTSAELAAAFVFVRAWRFVRVGHGLYASVHEISHIHMEEHVHHLEKYIAELEKQQHVIRRGASVHGAAVST